MPPAKTKAKPQTSTNKADKLLQAVLSQAAFDGWTQTALQQAAKSTGVTEAELKAIYPRGVRDAVAAFSAASNEAMRVTLVKEKLFARMRVRDKVAFAVRTRFEQLAPHREAMRQLCLWYALPQHAPDAVRNLAKLCDVIWRTTGNDSDDFNFYTKRALLAYVIKTTTLFWLGDDSKDHAATWDFLDRRIAEVLQLGKAAGHLRDLPNHLGQLGNLANLFNRYRRAA